MFSCDEYIVEIDENGKINKIPYSPLLDVMGEEDYKKYIKKLEENKLNKEVENEEEDYEKLIEDLKDDIIKRIPDLIEIEDMKDADIVLIIHNDFTQWDVRKNEEVNPRYLEYIKEVANLSFYWLKRKNQQDDIEKILDYINEEVRKKW